MYLNKWLTLYKENTVYLCKTELCEIELLFTFKLYLCKIELFEIELLSYLTA